MKKPSVAFENVAIVIGHAKSLFLSVRVWIACVARLADGEDSTTHKRSDLPSSPDIVSAKIQHYPIR